MDAQYYGFRDDDDGILVPLEVPPVRYTPKDPDLVYSERAEPEFLPAGSATLTLQEILLPALIQSWITTYRCFLLCSYEL